MVKSPGQHSEEFNRRLQDIKAHISVYRGVSSEFNEIIDLMHDLEKWLVEVFGDDEKTRLATEQERDISRKLIGDPNNAIDDLLDSMSLRFEQWVRECLGRSDNSNLLFVDTKSVFLPPQDPPAMIPNEGKHKFEEVQFNERLLRLIVLLSEEGIFLDDLIILPGEVDSNMMRQAPYYVVEITCLQRQILICDEIGEATFVVRGILDRDKFKELDKEELQLQYPHKVRRVVHYTERYWRETIKKYLFEEVGKIEKVDVRQEEDLRRIAKAVVPTAKEWSELSLRKLKKLRFNGMGFQALGTGLGVSGERSRSLQLAIGRKIYGEHELLTEWTAEEIVREIKKDLPTAEDWVNYPVKKRSHYRKHGIGLMTLTGMLGESFNPFDRKEDFLKLGRMIYGDQDVLRARTYTREEVIDAIKEDYPTAEDWIMIPARTRKQVGAFGMGLDAVATLLGFTGKKKFNFQLFIEVGKEIYGDDPIFSLDEVAIKAFRTRKKKHMSPTNEDLQMRDRVKEAITAKIATPEAWAERTGNRYDFKICGMGVSALASLFGVEGNPLARTGPYLALGRAIYGDHETLQEKEWTLDELREDVFRQLPTAEDWAATKVRKRRSFKVFGMGLVALSTRFGLEGDPTASRPLYMELGQKIYGECEILRNWTLDEIRTEIKKEIPTMEEWSAMTQGRRLRYSVCRMKLNRLARRFGIKEDPVGYKRVHIELGKLIYG